jgi:hypothetical protein
MVQDLTRLLLAGIFIALMVLVRVAWQRKTSATP